ncbi:beta-ketoacyl synthase N-terminal-like domain-containing protein [Streptomyces sp. NPDC017940]|uniref:beta-ketoacyl synthase N-terminal-like domain-containing protein n=1 Tax=Streptomyces sp. NPDC017940 TaxID=3365017 RepID=UPI0037A8867B
MTTFDPQAHRSWPVRPGEPVAIVGIAELDPGTLDDVVVDVARFGIPPMQAKSMNRMQLLMLEAARRCLADAGHPDRPLPAERTDVITGLCFALDRQHANALRVELPRYAREVERAAIAAGAEPDRAARAAEELRGILTRRLGGSPHDRVGEMASTIPARIAAAFKLRGRTLAVESAEATSFVAVAQAVRQLRAEVSDAALVLAGQRRESPYVAAALAAKFRAGPGMGGPERPGDGGPRALPLTEGVGAVLLKRLPDAVRDGDRVYATILDCTLRHDPSPGCFRPSRSTALRRLAAEESLRAAGVGAETVQYVEAVESALGSGVDTGHASAGAGGPSGGVGLPSGGVAHPSGDTGHPSADAGHPSGDAGHPSGDAGHPSTDAGHPSGGIRHPSGGIGRVFAGAALGTGDGRAFAHAGLAALAKVASALHARRYPAPGGAAAVSSTGTRTGAPWTTGVRSGVPRRAVVHGASLTGTFCHLVLEERPGAGAVPAGAVPAAKGLGGAGALGAGSGGTGPASTTPIGTGTGGAAPAPDGADPWSPAPVGTGPANTAPTGTGPGGTAPTGTAPTGTGPASTAPGSAGQGRAGPGGAGGHPGPGSGGWFAPGRSRARRVRGAVARAVPIAVVGLGGRFAGADDAAGFWRVVRSGRTRIAPVPDSVLDRELYHSPGALSLTHTYTDRGGHVPVPAEPPEDPVVLPPRYAVLDGAQRLALTVAAELFAPRRARGRPTGRGIVAVGGTLGPTRERRAHTALALGGLDDTVTGLAALGGLTALQRKKLLERLRERTGQDEHGGGLAPALLDGCLASGVAALLANEYGLAAVPLAVEAACASSLAALDIAVGELRAGTADYAVAGGVELACTERDMVLCSALGLLSHGTNAPFDAAADGFTPGDGCGLFLLKRYDDALRDGDPIHGLIRAVGASNDAKSLIAPDVDGQVRAMQRAFAQVDFEPCTVDYLEAHGTGTKVGDRVEIAAAARLYAGGPRAEPLRIGSAKSFFGHTFAAAGSAGLLRTLLALRAATLPPNTSLRTLNPALGLAAIPAEIRTGPAPWTRPPGRPRRAAVSSFGTGGINYHVLVEEHPDGRDAPDEVQEEEVRPR